MSEERTYLPYWFLVVVGFAVGAAVGSMAMLSVSEAQEYPVRTQFVEERRVGPWTCVVTVQETRRGAQLTRTHIETNICQVIEF